MSRVAVVIPFQDLDEGLIGAVNSVIRQEYKVFFIILVQNNFKSQMSESLVLTQFMSSENIKLLIMNNCLNANEARNFGAVHAIENGFEYIAFLDSDDYWSEDHLSKCIQFFDQNNCDVLFSSFSVNDGCEKKVFINNCSGDILSDLFVTKSIDCRSSCLFLLASAYLKVPLDINLKKHQDWGYAVDASKNLRIHISSNATVMINISLRERMSTNVNPQISFEFANSRLVEPYYSNFLFSRIIEGFSKGSSDAYYLMYPSIRGANLTFKRKMYFILMPIVKPFNLVIAKIYRKFLSGANK
ncbi:glycosyltransferase family 2 protein [Vibrio navarrensis]